MSDNTQYQHEERQAASIARLLDGHAQHLDMRTLKKLEDGRTRALDAHAQQLAGILQNRDGTLSLLRTWVTSHWILMTGLVIGTLIFAIITLRTIGQPSEDSDAFLLGAELPPEAFVDTGFAPWLNNASDRVND